MNMLNLAGRVCCTFSMNDTQQMRTVQKVKENQSRDVVTELDMKLHEVSELFIAERLPECNLLSEESNHDGFIVSQLLDKDWLIVDPLDGSSNYALGMPNYGYMAAYLRNGHLFGSVIVLPEQKQYIVREGNQSIYAQPLPLNDSWETGSVYYAYPPQQSTSARQAKFELLNLIDSQSAGMYRYGSACAGLYQLLCGRHMAFIGHGIRLWDAIAFIPILTAQDIKAIYCINGLSITLLASRRGDFLENVSQILQKHQGLLLHNFDDVTLSLDLQ